jgi:DNA-directed RNA polymerase specialized sigma24 family protein
MAVNPAELDEGVVAGAARLRDAQLRDGLRAGRSAAFTQLYEEHAARIYNLCLRLLGSPEDAQDVTQDVFLKAHRSSPGCAEDLRVEAWLYRVAVNACYDLLRAQGPSGHRGAPR